MTVLAGKVVVVTGAGRGIGRAIAKLCAAEGAKVVVNDLGGDAHGNGIDANPANAVVDEIRADGGQAIPNVESISDPKGAESIIEDAVGHFGRIDAVVNNAGFLRDAIFHKISHKDWLDVVDVHLNGYFNVSRAAANHFRDQGSGSYIHLTSTSALIGLVGQSNYSAAKAGVIGLSTSIALDMRRFGVRSNCVAPTAWSRLTSMIPTDTEARKFRIEKMKSATPEKIAPLVAFLCSDAAADVSGQTFGVRNNEVFLYSRPSILRTMQMSDGWTPQSCADILMPALRPSFQPLVTTPEVISWAPQ